MNTKPILFQITLMKQGWIIGNKKDSSLKPFIPAVKISCKQHNRLYRKLHVYRINNDT